MSHLFLEHLPVYVSVDAILDVLHLSFDRMVMDVEEAVLLDRLEDVGQNGKRFGRPP